MSHKRVEPVSEGMMLCDKYPNYHTICQTLRDIYVLTDNEDIKYKCRLAMAMAKKMQDKLKEYREKEVIDNG